MLGFVQQTSLIEIRSPLPYSMLTKHSQVLQCQWVEYLHRTPFLGQHVAASMCYLGWRMARGQPLAGLLDVSQMAATPPRRNRPCIQVLDSPEVARAFDRLQGVICVDTPDRTACGSTQLQRRPEHGSGNTVRCYRQPGARCRQPCVQATET